MTVDGRDHFDREFLARWRQTTRLYLLRDPDRPAGGIPDAGDGWSPPGTNSHGGRKRYLARVRGLLMRAIARDGGEDPLDELQSAFQRQVTFVARHPDVARRLLSWLAQDDEPGLQRRVRRLVGHFADHLAGIIARARQLGRVRDDIDPRAAAMVLVGVIQALALRTSAASCRSEWLLPAAAETFARYRAALMVAPG